MKKQSFILYTDTEEQISILSDAQAGQLFKLLLRVASGEEKPRNIADPMVKMAFCFIAAQIERDAQKYEEVCQKRSEYGKKGGRPRTVSPPKEKSICFSKKAKKADTDTEHDPDPDTESILILNLFLILNLLLLLNLFLNLIMILFLNQKQKMIQRKPLHRQSR